jgi:tetratricopeptide (TPR) repeat protein
VVQSDASRLRQTAAELQQQGRFGDAATVWRRLLADAPEDSHGWVALAGCLLLDRRPQAALDACEAGLRLLPAEAPIFCAKARVLQSVSRVADAAAAYRDALAVDPDTPEARFGLALQAAEAGDWDAAAGLAEPLVAKPGAGPQLSWLMARVALGRGDAEHSLQHAKAGLAAPDLSPDQRAELALLMGEALDSLGRAPEAFQAFTHGKTALRAFYAVRAAGSEAETAKLNRLADWFDTADPWRASPPAASTLVRGHAFLVGFPRSGTTLLEQALAGHPDLAALEEAPTLADAYAALMTSPAGLERLALLSVAETEHWRAHYWRMVAEAGADPAGRVFLDKAPAGTLYLPLIAKLFPAAKILFAIRDPRDVALSCFRNSFQMNALTYAFTDLVETARCYAASMRMASVYRRVLPLDLAEVRYEALVDDFPGELARICAFLGLEASPGMTDVAATARRRIVRTPSASQIRAGLNRSGLGRWRAYERELSPIQPILAPWVEAFGYGASG